MDPIITNEKFDLAIKAFEKLSQALSESGHPLPDVVPIVLIGGSALESYGVREAGQDIDIFIPSECWGSMDLDCISNDLMSDDSVYKRLKASLESDPDHDPSLKVIELMKDRDLCTELDNGNFEDLVDPIKEIEINGTKFQFKMPDLATIAFSKSNSFREKDLRDVSLIVEKIGIERYMKEGNRLREIHGDHRIGDFIKDALSDISINLAMGNDYLDYIKNSLKHLRLDPDVMSDLYSSFGLDVDEQEFDEKIWPDDDWEPSNNRDNKIQTGVKL